MGQLSVNGGAKIVSAAVFSAETEAKARERLEQLLDAETTVRVRAEEGQQITYERVPDNPVRLAAAVKIIEWNRGKPRQSVELTKPGEQSRRLTAADLARIIRDSPGVVDEFIGTLKTAQAPEAQPLSSDSGAEPPESQSEGPHSSGRLSVQMLAKPEGQGPADPIAPTSRPDPEAPTHPPAAPSNP